MIPRHFILALCAVITACAGSPSAEIAADDYAYVAEAIAPRVHVLRQPAFHIQPRGNVTIIEQARGIVLIDSGGSPAGAEEVIAHVRALTGKPVTAIVLTHWHGDHVLGVSRLLEQWPQARVIATEATRVTLARSDLDRYMPGENAEANARLLANIRDGVAYLEGESANSALAEAERAAFADAAREYAAYGETMAAARRTPPTEAFAERLDLPDAQAPIELHFLGRANTDGDAIAWLPRQRVLITGDVVVSPIPYGFNVYPREWTEVLRRLDAYEYDVLVPGHGAPMRDGAYLARLIAALDEVRAQAALSTDAQLDLAAQRETFVGEDPWLRRWFDEYWIRPITASAYKEARGETITQGE